MMNKQNTPAAWSWTCRCGRIHPLRHRRCSRCREAMPQSVRTAVYKAELTFQRKQHRDVLFRRSTLRMKKMNSFLSVTLVILTIAAILLTGYVCYDCRGMISQIDLEEYCDIAILRVEEVWRKVRTLDVNTAGLTDKLRYVPEQLEAASEKILVIPNRLEDVLGKLMPIPDRLGDALGRLLVLPDQLSGLGEKLETMAQQIGNIVADSADKIDNMIKHIQVRVDMAMEYVQELISEIQ